MNTDKIFDFLSKGYFKFALDKRFGVDVPSKLTPSDFLSFAEKDLESEKGRAAINCLSNVKRALDCQLDWLLFAFGMLEQAKKKQWNFPRKIEWLKELDIIAPRILEKINKRRNLLEHEFKQPSRREVEDSLDVAWLFAGYTSSFMQNLVSDGVIHRCDRNDSRSLHVCFNPLQGLFVIQLLREQPDLTFIVEQEIELKCNSPDYNNFLKCYLKIMCQSPLIFKE